MRTMIGLLIVLLLATIAAAQDKPVDKLPHIQVDIKARQVRVECQALGVEAPLEFFCVLNGTSEHETVLRSAVKPSDLHLALLMLGLQPGEGAKFSPSLNKWIAPHGPPLQITCEWEKDGKTVSLPAYRLMRDIKTRKEMPPLTWIFSGSKLMEDRTYAADTTGYIVSIVNFEFTMIDIPRIASNSNESLEWERNADLAPPPGTKVTMVIEATGKDEPATGAGATAPAATQPMGAISDVTTDQAKMDRLRERWVRAVSPHQKALKEAAQTHYEVINAMRREQQRLIDEADRIQRSIDQLEKSYQEMTTPRPEPMQP